MPKRKPTEVVTCRYYTWKLFIREGVYYADGRSGPVNLGKHSLGTRDRNEALETLQRLDRQKAKERGLVQPEPITAATKTSEAVTIDEGWRDYMLDVKNSEITGGAGNKTLQRYSAVRDKHLKYCMEQKTTAWTEIDKAHIRGYGSWLKHQKYAPRTIYLEMTTLKSVNKFLVREHRLTESLRIHLPVRRPQGSDTYCYSLDQVKAIIQWCEQTAELDWLGDYVRCLAASGLRAGEAASLRCTDVQLDASGTPLFFALTDERSSDKRKKLGMEIRKTKGKRSRMVPIDPSLRDMVKRLIRDSRDGFLFHGAQGFRINVDRVREQFVKHAIVPLSVKFLTQPGEIGFRHGRLHGFRHFFVSQAFLSGAHEAEIKDWVGHRDSRIVELYRHLGHEESRQRFLRMNILKIEEGPDGLDPEKKCVR